MGVGMGRRKGPEPEPADFLKMLVEYAGSLNDATTLIGSAAMLTAFYFGASLVFTTKEKRAWLITTFSSVVMTIAGVFFTSRLYATSGEVMTAPGAFDSMAAKMICLFFLAYCIVDTTACAILYPGQESIGFGHHAGYAALLVYLIYTGRQVLFAIFAIEELPTLFLSVYELRGDTRPRLPTGLAIFSMRMVRCPLAIGCTV